MKLSRLALERNIIVCCGAGGVGKTTTSAALALSAAREGRRALVLTIDPAKRLAQALGIPPTGKEPVRIADDLLNAADVECKSGGEIHAWMLDPSVVLEGVVDRFAPSAEDARKIRSTRLYQALSELIVGLQEYTAAEALYSFNEEGRYDLIVLDTPPSRNALDFLDSPRRLARFLDERTLSIFVPGAKRRLNPLVRAASRVVSTAMAKTFGESFVGELQSFLSAFGKLFSKMRIHAKGVRQLLSSEHAAFVVITSPDEAALDEALFFKGRIQDLGLVSQGFILNRSYASKQDFEHPLSRRTAIGDNGQAALVGALDKLVPLADHEEKRVLKDRVLLEQLDSEGQKDGGGGAVALPYLDIAVEDLPALNILSNHILSSR